MGSAVERGVQCERDLFLSSISTASADDVVPADSTFLDWSTYVSGVDFTDAARMLTRWFSSTCAPFSYISASSGSGMVIWSPWYLNRDTALWKLDSKMLIWLIIWSSGSNEVDKSTLNSIYDRQMISTMDSSDHCVCSIFGHLNVTLYLSCYALCTTTQLRP